MEKIKNLVSLNLISNLKIYRKETDDKLEKMERKTNNKIFFGFFSGILFTTFIYNINY